MTLTALKMHTSKDAEPGVRHSQGLFKDCGGGSTAENKSRADNGAQVIYLRRRRGGDKRKSRRDFKVKQEAQDIDRLCVFILTGVEKV